MNIPYEIFLTIQMHLTRTKDRIHNRLQAKKDETCSKEQVVDVYVTSKCIHLYFLCIITQCLFWDVLVSCHALMFLLGGSIM